MSDIPKAGKGIYLASKAAGQIFAETNVLLRYRRIRKKD